MSEDTKRLEPLPETMSPADIERELVRVLHLLEDETYHYKALSEDSAKKHSWYKGMYWEAYLRAEGAVREREAIAGEATKVRYKDDQVAEAAVKAQREVLASLRTRVDILRTLSANVREQT